MNMNRVVLGLMIAMGCSGTAMAQVGNTLYGIYALNSNTNGSYNSAFGGSALNQNSIGSYNTASGYAALYLNTIGNYNNAFGGYALFTNTTGSYNTATGSNALYLSTTGSYNTSSGAQALYENTTGHHNTASGYRALLGNTNGSNNTASGTSALNENQTGIRNSAFGSNALYNNSNGSNNIGIGYQGGYYPTGSNNIDIGAAGAATDNAVIRIGTQGTQKKTYLAGVRGVNVTGGVAVMVTATGQLGVVSSSRRYKEDIRSMGDTSDRLLKLRPVTFRYKQPDENGQKPEQFGLIAEEVAKVMPELLIYNEKGQPETVAYQSLAPLLLNELQKAEKKIEQMQAEIDELRKAH